MHRTNAVIGFIVLASIAGVVRARGETATGGTDADRARLRGPLRAAATATGPRTSPFEPPRTSDIQFVVDAAPGLDTGCSYRSDGPLEFDVEITRYVGPVDGSGKLLDPGGRVAAGVLSPRATFVLPAFDVDVFGDPSDPGTPPEVDRVSLNGKLIGTLTGDNDVWKLNQFEVDVADLRFPARAPLGSTPTPAHNTIHIDIDTASGADENWCTSVDWAGATFKAFSPVILVHGNNSDAGFWDRHGFSGALQAAKVPYDGCQATCDHPINLPTNFIANNGATLGLAIPKIVRTFGADSYHLIAHSKGGLDSREYLGAHQPSDLTLVSQTTLSTPHNGSLLADLAVINDIGKTTGAEVELSGFPLFTETLANLSGIDNGTRNLTTGFTAGFNARNLGALPTADYNQVAADADRNGSATIDSEAEIAALRLDSTQLPGLTFFATRIVNVMYQVLRNNAAIRGAVSTRTTILGRRYNVLTITAVPSASPNPNDVLVAIPSGLGAGSIASRSTHSATFTGANGRNHSDVADAGVAATVVPWLFSAERSRGDLR